MEHVGQMNAECAAGHYELGSHLFEADLRSTPICPA
jgi:hypothetical protein